MEGAKSDLNGISCEVDFKNNISSNRSQRCEDSCYCDSCER